MKVLLVVHGLPLGGAESVVRNLALALQDRHHSVLVVSLTSANTPVADQIRKSGIRVVGMHKPRGVHFPSVFALARIVADFEPDVVHSHLPILPYVVCAARLHDRRLPIVHTFHSVARKETASAFRRLLNRLCLRAGRVTPVALTPEVAISIAEVYRLPVAHVPVVPNGIDVAAYEAAPVENQSPPIFRILHVGRFVPEKDHEGLIETYALFRSRTEQHASQLTLVGDGPTRASAEALVRRRGLETSVRFTGAVTNTVLLYQDADILVLPSKYEGFPMVVIEAMAAGLPVVCSNLSTLSGVVRHGVDGFLEEPGSAAFTERLRQLLEDPALRRAMGDSAMERAASFSSDAMAEGYLRVYR